MQTPFIGPSYNLESRPASVQRTINLVPVPLEPGNERAPWVLKDVPGLVQVLPIPPAPCITADPYIDSVVLLLRGQGADGGTTITDSSDPSSPLVGSFNPPDSVTGVTTSSAQFLECFGESSLLFAATGNPGLRYSSANALTYLGNIIAAGGYDTWTIDAWVRQAASGVMALISYRPPVTLGWAFTTTGWRANIGSVWSDTWISVASPDAGVWTHVQMERDGSEWRYFTNGVLVGSFTNSGAITTNVAEVAVGHGSTSTTEQQFRGHMYLRFTVGVARSGGVNFAPPNNFPAV